MTVGGYGSDLSDDEKVLMAVVRAAESFKRVVTTVFRRFDLSFPQYNILRVLDASSDGKARISDVSRVMLVSCANMTGLAKRLEKAGFLVRRSDPADERVTLLEITDKGKKTLVRIEQYRDRLIEGMLEGFSEKEKSALLELVRRVLRNSRKIR
jgi:DNA-binding MarR family transcriptional regulator